MVAFRLIPYVLLYVGLSTVRFSSGQVEKAGENQVKDDIFIERRMSALEVAIAELQETNRRLVKENDDSKMAIARLSQDHTEYMDKRVTGS